MIFLFYSALYLAADKLHTDGAWTETSSRWLDLAAFCLLTVLMVVLAVAVGL